MRAPSLESRRAAALVVAIVCILAIVAMIVFFLEQSLVYSARASDAQVRAESLEVTDIGLSIAYQRLKNGFPLDNQDDEFKTENGRVWGRGEVSGTLDKQDGSDPGAYAVEVFYSELEKIPGRADGGSDNTRLVDADLRSVKRPAVWFKGKKFMMLTGDLAGLEIRINEFDLPTGTITFDAQPDPIAVGDVYEIPAGMEYQFLAEGTHLDSTRTVETWWWRQSRPLKKYSQRGAVVANGTVKVLGNIQIDGRDHCANGGQGMPEPDQCPSSDDHHILEDGVKGVSSTGLTDQGGSSTIGGDGSPPESEPGGMAYTEQYPADGDIDNGLDDDGDGLIDEDPYNGTDDDRDGSGAIAGDGKRDEDLRFPLNPDEALGLEKGSLKDIAKQSKTYFSSQIDFENYLITNGDVLPGGLVYYLEIPVLDMGKILMDMGGSDDPEEDPEHQKPIVFIVHYEDGDGNPVGEIRNMFIIMKGLVMADVLNKVNGSTRIIGGMQTFSTNDSANIYGNGAARIWYSTTALANLPDNVAGASWNSTAWRETP